MTDAPIVAILGTRYPDFRIEESILGPHGASLVSGDGGTADAIAEQASGATVVLAGSGPRFDAKTIGRLTCLGIVRYGVGVETVDVDAAARAGMGTAASLRQHLRSSVGVSPSAYRRTFRGAPPG